MAGAIRSLIIGGGVRAGTPATLSAFPIFSGTTPPDILVDGNIRQDTKSPPRVFIGDALLTPGATVIGGATANVIAQKCIVIGDGASYLPAGHNSSGLVIGRGASAIGFGGATVVGPAASSTGPNGDTVVIGRGATSTVDSTVVIGATASCSIGAQSIAIGFGAVTAGNLNNIAIGTLAGVSGGAGTGSCVVIGGSSSTNKPRNVLIGAGLIDANTAVGNIAIIGVGWTSTANMPSNACGFLNSSGFTTMIVGNGHESAAPGSLTFRLCNGLGANIAAGSLTLQAGLGTGTGASAVVNIASSIPIGAGSTLQTSRTGFRMSPSVAAGETDIMVYDVDNATLERVTVGAADSGGVGFKLLRIPN